MNTLIAVLATLVLVVVFGVSNAIGIGPVELVEMIFRLIAALTGGLL